MQGFSRALSAQEAEERDGTKKDSGFLLRDFIYVAMIGIYSQYYSFHIMVT